MHCERLKCKTSVDTCINRQHVATPVRFSQCVDCPQGKKVIADFKRRGKKPEPDIEALKRKVRATRMHLAEQTLNALNAKLIKPDLEVSMEKKLKEKDAPAAKKEEVATPKAVEGPAEGIVTVDFRRRPEVWEWLKEMADEDERTPEKELLHLAKLEHERWKQRQQGKAA